MNSLRRQRNRLIVAAQGEFTPGHLPFKRSRNIPKPDPRTVRNSFRERVADRGRRASDLRPPNGLPNSVLTFSQNLCRHLPPPVAISSKSDGHGSD